MPVKLTEELDAVPAGQVTPTGRRAATFARWLIEVRSFNYSCQRLKAGWRGTEIWASMLEGQCLRRRAFGLKSCKTNDAKPRSAVRCHGSI